MARQNAGKACWLNQPERALSRQAFGALFCSQIPWNKRRNRVGRQGGIFVAVLNGKVAFAEAAPYRPDSCHIAGQTNALDGGQAYLR